MKLLTCIIIKFLFSCLSFLFITYAYAAPNPEGIQVYQKDMHLSDEYKQKLAADIYRYYNADNLWVTLQHEFVLPHYEYMPQVQEQINWFLMHQDFLQRSASRAAPYLYYILQQVRKRHLPAEFVLLPLMESSYNPFAYSTVGAAGIWQMMPGTATGFGIKQNWWYDGRRDVVASTRAALDYVAYLGSYFGGNWLLAIAAYDTGEGNVLAAIKKNIRDGKNTDYWSLPLAQETRVYIPRLMALATIVSYPERYPFFLPPVRNAPYLAQIDLGGQIELKQAAQLAGLSLKKLMQLNPGFNRSSTDPTGPFKLVLPIEQVQHFTENLEHTPFHQTARLPADSAIPTPSGLIKKINLVKSKLSPDSSIIDTDTIGNSLANLGGKYALQPGDTLYMIRNGDNWAKISKRFHMEVNKIIAVNQLKDENSLQPGNKIIIPTHLTQINSTPDYPSSSEETIYMVRQGDDIASIAQKFHTSPAALRIANLLTTNQLQTGDRLVIPQLG